MSTLELFFNGLPMTMVEFPRHLSVFLPLEVFGRLRQASRLWSMLPIQACHWNLLLAPALQHYLHYPTFEQPVRANFYWEYVGTFLDASWMLLNSAANYPLDEALHECGIPIPSGSSFWKVWIERWILMNARTLNSPHGRDAHRMMRFFAQHGYDIYFLRDHWSHSSVGVVIVGRWQNQFILLSASGDYAASRRSQFLGV